MHIWTGSGGRPNDPWESKKAAARDWEGRWKAQSRGPSARADQALDNKTFEGSRLRLYEALARPKARRCAKPEPRSA